MNGITKKFSRLNLGCFPTPFHKLENIKKNLYIKRDDMTGVGLGGNKIRKLEFILAHAKKNGFDTIITTGGAQSNHATLTAACCKRLGLDVKLVLMGRGVMEERGNLLLDKLMDVDVQFVDTDNYADVYRSIKMLVEDLEDLGKKPFVVPLGGSMPLGVLGYIEAADELIVQAKEKNIKIDNIVSCVGSGGTYAGMLLGTKIIDPSIKVTGILVGEDENASETVFKLINNTCQLLDIENPVLKEDVNIKEYFGDGYAIPSESGNNGILTMARKEGLFLDPVYTGKTFGGILDLYEKGYFTEEEVNVFLLTGGSTALFAIDIDV